jgi:flagellar biogenesis protein FliO
MKSLPLAWVTGLWLLAGQAHAEEDANGFWSNSFTAAADLPGTPAGHWWPSLLAMLLVVGLILSLAWLVRRTGLASRPARPEDAEPKVVLFARFNARQTLMLLETSGALRAVILRGSRVELLADVPGNTPKGPLGPGRSGNRGKTFQELWWQCLQTGRRREK